MKQYKTGLVVGKFSPLHLGHEFVIREAENCCDKLIIISYSNPEMLGCAADRRERWLKIRFPQHTILVVTPEKVTHWQSQNTPIPLMPDNDAADDQHRDFVAAICKHILKATIDIVFTSESYGDGFAERLGNHQQHQVVHHLVDIERKRFSISGSVLRKDIHANCHYLSPEVYADFVERVAFLGGESSGKSTLAFEMAVKLQTLHAPEYGRERWEEKLGNLEYDDLLHIGKTQVEREDQLSQKAKRWLFCDTTPLTTFFYSNYMFNKAESELELLANRKYHHTFLCAPDFPFVQDGTRQDESFRNLQHEWYLKELSNRKISFTILQDNQVARINTVVENISA